MKAPTFGLATMPVPAVPGKLEAYINAMNALLALRKK